MFSVAIYTIDSESVVDPANEYQSKPDVYLSHWISYDVISEPLVSECTVSATQFISIWLSFVRDPSVGVAI